MLNMNGILNTKGFCKHRFNSFLPQILYFLCLINFMLLNGCSTTKVATGDGPPPFDVDVSQIQDATPRCEPLSKYGNMPTYRVFGKKYHVMRSAKRYHAQGVASWYGMKFHKRNTSSGEPYDLLAMTAAHRTLPLPTYVQVTNIKNGRKIIVKVNDRGPFAANRIIDLSYVAAKKLGMLGRGTAFVDVKAIDPNEANEHPNWIMANQSVSHQYAAKPYHHGVYLQVGAFKNRSLAENLKKRLTHIVTSPVRVTQLAKASNNLYRVQIGPIKDTATANHITKKLKQIGLHPEHKMA